jgi:CHRD domain-containing protein
MIVIRRLLAVLTLAAAFAALVVAAPAGADTSATRCTAATVLKPGNEVPPTTSRALGAAAIHVNGTTLTFSVVIANPRRETFIAGHIHVAPAGVNGPVVVPLFSGSSDRKLFFQAQRLDITEATATAICGNVAGYYVNYHTTEFPGGAVRGQLVEL